MNFNGSIYVFPAFYSPHTEADMMVLLHLEVKLAIVLYVCNARVHAQNQLFIII